MTSHSRSGAAASPQAAPRPPVHWPRALLGVGVAGALGATLLLGPEDPPGPLVVMVQYLSSASTVEIARGMLSAQGTVLGVGLSAAAITVVALALFAVGRWLIGPLWRRYGWRPPPPRFDGPPPLAMRVVMFALPPPPRPKPGAPPILVQRGGLVAALVHLVPPPGPAFLRLVVDALLGASASPWWKFALGAGLGATLHMSAAAVMVRLGITLPSPPLAMTIALLLAPIVITVLVRSVVLGARMIRRPAQKRGVS